MLKATSSLHNFGLTFGSKLLTILMTLATQSCLAYVMGPEARGAYAVCIIFATTLIIFFMFGCDFEGIHFVSSKQISITEGIIYSALFACIGAALASLVGVIILSQSFSFVTKAPLTSFYLSLGLVPSSVLALVLINLFTAVNLFGIFAVLYIIYGLIGLLLTIVFVWLLQWGIQGALLAGILRDIVIIMTALIIFHIKYGFTQISFSSAKFIAMLNYSIRYYFGKVGNLAGFQIGGIILAFFAPARDVGMFAIASQLTIQIILIPDSVSAVLTPKISAHSADQEHTVAMVSRFVGLITGLALLFLMIFAKPFVQILFSSDFLAVAMLIQVLAVGIFIRCVCKVFIPYLLATGYPQLVSVSSIVGTFVNLVILTFFYTSFGLKTAAFAMTAGYIVSSVLLTIGFINVSRMKFSTIWKPQLKDWDFMLQSFLTARRYFGQS